MNKKSPRSFRNKPIELAFYEGPILDIEKAIVLLDTPTKADEFKLLFKPFDIKNEIQSIDDDRINWNSEYGFELYFRDAWKHEDETEKYLHRTKFGLIPGEKVFVGFRLTRAGDMGSIGFRGKMPHSLQFSDSVADVRCKINFDPYKGEDSFDDDAGYLVWKMPHYYLHILFSVPFNCVYRVTVLTHAAYD